MDSSTHTRLRPFGRRAYNLMTMFTPASRSCLLMTHIFTTVNTHCKYVDTSNEAYNIANATQMRLNPVVVQEVTKEMKQYAFTSELQAVLPT